MVFRAPPLGHQKVIASVLKSPLHSECYIEYTRALTCGNYLIYYRVGGSGYGPLGSFCSSKTASTAVEFLVIDPLGIFLFPSAKILSKLSARSTAVSFTSKVDQGTDFRELVPGRKVGNAKEPGREEQSRRTSGCNW